MTDTVFVGLGSNLGDRFGYLCAAVRALAADPAIQVVRISSVYRSAPVGVLDQPWFLNAVAELRTTHEPEALLGALKGVEVALGRTPRRRWGEREIDLDLLDEARGRKGGFGAVRAVRQPLPMCRAEVSSCYEHRADELGCVNPEFFELPRGKPSFRVVEQSDQAA